MRGRKKTNQSGAVSQKSSEESVPQWKEKTIRWHAMERSNKMRTKGWLLDLAMWR